MFLQSLTLNVPNFLHIGRIYQTLAHKGLIMFCQVEQLQVIMNNMEHTVSKFLWKAMDRRKQTLYTQG